MGRPGVAADHGVFGQATGGLAVAGDGVEGSIGGGAHGAWEVAILAAFDDAVGLARRELGRLDATAGKVAVEPLVEGAFDGEELAAGDVGWRGVRGVGQVFFLLLRDPGEYRVVYVVAGSAVARARNRVTCLLQEEVGLKGGVVGKGQVEGEGAAPVVVWIHDCGGAADVIQRRLPGQCCTDGAIDLCCFILGRWDRIDQTVAEVAGDTVLDV